MVKTILVLLVALVAIAAGSQQPLFGEEIYQQEFVHFAKTFNKNYPHDQFFERYNVFKANLDFIHLHNLKAESTNDSFTMEMNHFGDLSFNEFHSLYTGYKHIENPHSRAMNMAPLHNLFEAVPTSIDWRTKNAVTPVKDQGQCGSCWAFSAIGAVEGAFAIKNKKLQDFSEQELVDCAQAQGNEGCNGGLMDGAFEYIIAAGGNCPEKSYPYKAMDGKCKSSTCPRMKTITGYKDVKANDEKALATAALLGPVSVAIEADQPAFQFYSKGIFSSPCGTNLDHGVLVVGFGTEAGKDYWIVKNSWGGTWGDKGYIRIARGKNLCGIAMQPSYPTI
jgi:C1A family cysteine protease